MFSISASGGNKYNLWYYFIQQQKWHNNSNFTQQQYKLFFVNYPRNVKYLHIQVASRSESIKILLRNQNNKENSFLLLKTFS